MGRGQLPQSGRSRLNTPRKVSSTSPRRFSSERRGGWAPPKGRQSDRPALGPSRRAGWRPRGAGTTAPDAPAGEALEARSLEVARRVAAKANRQHSADSVLRHELKQQRGLPRSAGELISRAVFAYYRWWGWLAGTGATVERLRQALKFADRYLANPAAIGDEELAIKAVPGWIGDCLEIRPPWLRVLQQEPMLWLRARRGQGASLASTLGDCQPFGSGDLADILRYRGAQDLYRHPLFQAGEFEMQDIHSQAVGRLCDPRPGETWWDACAGEGGKTLHLSDLMRNQGLIWASDRAAWRLLRLRQRAARARVFNYRAVEWDGSARLPTRTLFDGVLLDAPCSGVGNWQRQPYARWTTTPQDVVELGGIQKSLLKTVASAVKPGGKLVYAVCSLTRAETTEVVQAFNEQMTGFLPLRTPDPFASQRRESETHWFRPEDRPGNGMFVALWRRA